MPRAMWSGAISFGLVSIPVKLYTAVSTKSVRFNQIDSRTGSRVKQKRVSAVDGSEVSYDDIVKGYEVMKDTYITVTDEEIESLSPKASRSIDILEFVEEDEIDPLYYQNAYYLVPDELARKSYALLAEAMEADGRVALAKFVMRTKEYLAAVRPSEGKLVMSTMVYSDEVVATEEIPGFEELEEIEVSDAEKMMATQLIESLAGAFDPAKYEDTYREKVLALIEQKSSGELTTVSAPEPAESAGVIDLLAALEASVAAAKKSRGRHPTAGEEAEDTEVEEVEDEAEEAELVSIGAAKSSTKKAAKKTPAKRAKKAPAKRAAAKKKPAKKATTKKAAKKSA